MPWHVFLMILFKNKLVRFGLSANIDIFLIGNFASEKDAVKIVHAMQ